MTDREKAIVMAYTGCTMLAGDKLGIFYQYVKEKLGRSVMTHELAYEEVRDAIKEAAKEDFIAIAKADNGWTSVKERLPIASGRYLTTDYNGLSQCLNYSAKYKAFNAFDDLENNEHIIDVEFWMNIPEPTEVDK